MSQEILKYIREHPYIYQYLREDSKEYQYLFQDNNYIYELEKKAKEKYKIRFIDKLDKLGNTFQMIQTFLDYFN